MVVASTKELGNQKKVTIFEAPIVRIEEMPIAFGSTVCPSCGALKKSVSPGQIKCQCKKTFIAVSMF